MNWTELRPKLREQYGNRFGFYNDKYRSGKRRVKIYGVDQNEMKQFIHEQDPNLIVNDYDWKYMCGVYTTKCVVVNFSE